MSRKKALLIVESPTKARTIKRFLPDHFMVEASIGHVHDLPQNAKEIPAAYKDQEWAKLGIDVENDFKALYVIPKGKTKIIQTLKKLLKEADVLYLATDEDREGESISWHLVQVLKPAIPVRRMVFHEITKDAIVHALETARDIDENLVQAQEARRLLDRLYGYSLSPLLWHKIAYGLSAGRVQSSGLRILCQREEERSRFVSASYHSLTAVLDLRNNEKLDALLVRVADKVVASSADFNPETALLEKENALLLTEEDSEAFVKRLKGNELLFLKKESKASQQKAPRPFITSSFQQEANRQFSMNARESMRVAQKLYEEGLITYMRTDSYQLSTEAQHKIRSWIKSSYGEHLIAENFFGGAKKGSHAQEAHEAIRPAGDFIAPDKLVSRLDENSLKIYTLIWKRSIAALMKPAEKITHKLTFAYEELLFTSSHTHTSFPGFLRVYPEKIQEERQLPEWTAEEKVPLADVYAQKHHTQAPVRYSEASLIGRLESEGIGRPSTYASIISTLIDRQYVFRRGTTLIPSFMGMAVSRFIERFFPKLVDYRFTSNMEEQLDRIALGQESKLDYLKNFYLGPNGLLALVLQKEQEINLQDSRTLSVYPSPQGPVSLQIGRYGAYLSTKHEAKDIHINLPLDLPPSELNEEKVQDLLHQQSNSEKIFGKDPQTGLPLYFRISRYGPYLQLGDVSEENPKPKRSSLPKNATPENISLETALNHLSLPKTLGVHPQTHHDIILGRGPFGYFLQHDTVYVSLRHPDPFSIQFEEALELIEKKIQKERENTLLDLGTVPALKVRVRIVKGRYGPYIKAGRKNISLGNLKDEEKIRQLSREDVVSLIKKNKK